MNSAETHPHNFTEGRILKTVESILNTINHILIGLTTFYMSWHIFHGNLTTMPLHAWLCTFGFQFLMAQGISILNPENSWSRHMPPKIKPALHWIFQVSGATLGVSGVFLMVSRIPRKHFKTTHGVLGVIGTVLILLNLVGGLCNVSSAKLERYLKPNTIKALHCFLGISGFVFALMSLFYGYRYYRRQISVGVLNLLEVSTAISTMLTLIGAFKSLFSHLHLNDLFSQ